MTKDVNILKRIREIVERWKEDTWTDGLSDDSMCEISDLLGETEQEPCEDCISRDMALEKMADYVSSGHADSMEDFEEYSKIICELPSVNPAPKMGHWSHDGSHWENRWICLECGYKLFDEQTRFCPNCGAKMEG